MSKLGVQKKNTHQRTRNQDKAALLFYFASLSLLSYRFGFSHFKFTRICAIPSLHFISLHIKCSSIQHPLHLYSFHHKICGCLCIFPWYFPFYLVISFLGFLISAKFYTAPLRMQSKSRFVMPKRYMTFGI